jgi:hypothetical protein
MACDVERGAAGDGVLSDLLPAVVKYRHIQGRFEQRIALLRLVEAIRMYAAAHEGKWPEKLADAKLPLPIDPFTGKEFRYEVEGSTAHIHGGSAKSEDKNQAYGIHVVVTMKK